MSYMPMSQEQMDLEANWRMPGIAVGSPVCWYSKWDKSGGPSLGFVCRVSIRSVEVVVFTPTGMQRVGDVLHKDDPRLRTNTNLQGNGSWDYSEIEQRLQKLEAGAKPVEVHFDPNVATFLGGEIEVPVVKTPKPAKPPKQQRRKRDLTPEQRKAMGERLAYARARSKELKAAKLAELNGAIAE